MTAAEHRDAAVQHLAAINDIGIEPSEACVLTQAAIAHALLGLLDMQIDKLGPVEIDLTPRVRPHYH